MAIYPFEEGLEELLLYSCVLALVLQGASSWEPGLLQLIASRSKNSKEVTWQ